jgi:hypothetical protein
MTWIATFGGRPAMERRHRPEEPPLPVEKRRARIRTIWFLFVAFLVTVVMLFLLRLGR